MKIQHRTPQPHTHHDQIREAIRSWFHQPPDANTMAPSRQKWGAIWPQRDVYPQIDSAAELPDFLAELPRIYAQCGRVNIVLDSPHMVDMLQSPLTTMGAVREADRLFLAHVGVFPAGPQVAELLIRPLAPENLAALTGLHLPDLGIADGATEAMHRLSAASPPDFGMMRGGRGLLASVEGKAVGVLWSYAGADDVWINMLGVDPTLRVLEIAQMLLKTRVALAYSRGYRSVLISVEADNLPALRFYHKLGFRDEVYQQRRYRMESKFYDRFCDRLHRRSVITQPLY